MWMTHPCTRVVLLSLLLDNENLRDSWSLGNFSSDENLKAQGQSFYIMGMDDDMRHMLADMEVFQDDAS